MTLVPVSPLANTIPTEVVPLVPRDVQHAARAQGPQHNKPVQAGEKRQEEGVHFGCLLGKDSNPKPKEKADSGMFEAG